MSTDIPVNITITATDEASDTITNTGTNMTGLLTGVSNLSNGAFGLYSSFSRVQDSETTLDRTHITLERSTTSVNTAQENYNKAVAKYGEDSPQAIDAANKLKTAQDALKVAHERVDEAQKHVNESMVASAVQVIPSVIGIVTSLGGIFTALGGAGGTAAAGTTLLGDAMEFLTSTLGIITIIVIIIGLLITAYETCKPFRDAINAIGTVIYNFLKPAIDDLISGLTWFWSNVLVPLGTFIVSYFVGYWTGLVYVFNILKTGVTDIYNAFYWLWQNILVPMGNFIQNTFTGIINGVMKVLQPLIDGIKTVVNIGKTVGGAIGNALHAIGLAEGGIVTQPTLAVVGEAGPEAVIPLNQLSTSSNSGGSSATYNVSIPITIQGSVDNQTLQKMKEMIKNVVVEATSSNVSTTQKRIRLGSVF